GRDGGAVHHVALPAVAGEVEGERAMVLARRCSALIESACAKEAVQGRQRGESSRVDLGPQLGEQAWAIELRPALGEVDDGFGDLGVDTSALAEVAPSRVLEAIEAVAAVAHEPLLDGADADGDQAATRMVVPPGRELLDLALERATRSGDRQQRRDDR